MKHWLMKAEPDSRFVKGKDVKFSVDDFEAAGTTAWEGVRNFEARNLMKEMTIGDKVLFYHSNCKNPGVAGFAEVCKEAYPDHTAWDSSHPYYDSKSDKDAPKWFMVDLKFTGRAPNFVSLSVLRYVSTLTSNVHPEEIAYIGSDGVKVIKGMPLLNRGRLSVQRVSQECWDLIRQMAERSGWENISTLQKAGKAKAKPKTKTTEDHGSIVEKGGRDSRSDTKHSEAGSGRKRKQLADSVDGPRRKSARAK